MRAGNQSRSGGISSPAPNTLCGTINENDVPQVTMDCDVIGQFVVLENTVSTGLWVVSEVEISFSGNERTKLILDN